MLKKITPLLVLPLFFLGCVRETFQPSTGQMGYKPIYASSGNFKNLIRSTAAKPLTETGKIYVKGNMLLINKPFSGIHVIDNTDPQKPINKAFIEIPGNMDVAMKGNMLFADYAGKIAVIDLADINAPVVKQSVELDTEFQQYPPQADNQNSATWRTYFECPDPEKGTVIAWVYTNLKSAKCWRNRQ